MEGDAFLIKDNFLSSNPLNDMELSFSAPSLIGGYLRLALFSVFLVIMQMQDLYLLPNLFFVLKSADNSVR